MDNRTKALCDFLNAAHSVYHAQAYLAETLKNAGYTRLYEQDEWALAPGGKYFLTRGGSALVAFRVPQGSPKGFLMSASSSSWDFACRMAAAMTTHSLKVEAVSATGME